MSRTQIHAERFHPDHTAEPDAVSAYSLPVYPSFDEPAPAEDPLDSLPPAEAIRELFERIFNAPAGQQHRIHDLAYARVCTVMFCLTQDPALVEALQPAVVAQRLGLAKQSTCESMQKFAARIGMLDSFVKRQRADGAHNRSRTLLRHHRRPITASAKAKAEVLPGLRGLF